MKIKVIAGVREDRLYGCDTATVRFEGPALAHAFHFPVYPLPGGVSN